ncbi:MAG: helix-turn-helix transcriptional regulator [Cyclobacteriaceae bacterium]
MKKTAPFPDALKNAKKSNWLNQVEFDLANEDWLDLSFEIALRVYSKIKADGKSKKWLAEQLGCSPQYVGKMLKGKENLTLQTITKLEHVLGINLITLATPTQEFKLDLDVKPNVPNIGNLTMDSQRQELTEAESYTDYQSYQFAS